MAQMIVLTFPPLHQTDSYWLLSASREQERKEMKHTKEANSENTSVTN
jgi:hypothetical protein